MPVLMCSRTVLPQIRFGILQYYFGDMLVASEQKTWTALETHWNKRATFPDERAAEETAANKSNKRHHPVRMLHSIPIGHDSLFAL